MEIVVTHKDRGHWIHVAALAVVAISSPAYSRPAQDVPSSSIESGARPIAYPSRFSGKDFGAKAMAALNALPLSGGIIDATDLHGPQDWTTPIIITKPVTLRLPCTRLLAKNANLIITPPHGSGRLVGVDVGGCGQATEIVTTGGPGYRNRVIRILGNYSPTLIVPPVGPTATGSSIAGSTIIRAVSDQIPSGGHDGFLETLKIGDSITVVGASLRSPNGMVSPVVALNRNEIVLAREVPITVKTAYLRLSIGGYRLPVTLGSINALSNQLVVGDAGNFAVGDMVRVVGAGPKGADLFSSVAAASDNELMLQSNATLTVVNQIVQYATLAGQTTLSTASVSDASDVLPGDWIHIGEWMNYAANNSDWNRMEWKQIAQVNGTKLIFSEPLQASYGHSAFPGANGCPVFWRKVTGLIERTRIHDLSISSVDGVSAIGVEAQNGRLLEVDHVGVNLRKGLGFFTVNQQGAFIHDNSCGSERCADFGGLTDSRVQNNTFRNVGEGPVAILELGSARNVVRDNQFLNADNNHENPYVAALGGSGIDSNTIEANVVSATHRASCFSILGGSANIIRGNKCTGGIAGVVIQDWPAPDPARIAANNVVAGNVLRNSKIGIDVISTLTTRAARNLNSVQGNDTDSSVVIPLRLFGTTSVETRTTP